MSVIFCDGVGDFSVVNGVVRFDLQRIVMVRGENQPATEALIAMPLAGAMSLLDSLSRLREELIKQGRLKIEEPPSAASPNFR